MYDWKAVRENYLKQGLCPRCYGRNPLEPGFKRCRECGLKEAERNRRYREQRMLKGMCPSCGVRKPEPGYMTCSRCRDIVKRRQEKREQDGSKLRELSVRT